MTRINDTSIQGKVNTGPTSINGDWPGLFIQGRDLDKLNMLFSALPEEYKAFAYKYFDISGCNGYLEENK